MPDFWGGYLLVPDAVEFWQAGTFRLHDRLRYRRAGDGGRLGQVERPASPLAAYHVLLLSRGIASQAGG